MKTTHIPSELSGYLKGCRVTTSVLSDGLTLQSLTETTTACYLFKENQRRRIFLLQTPQGEYFLKISTLIRRKDRLRHFVLPMRRDAEWRNLHRLRRMLIDAARPIMKGHKNRHFFFIVTRGVCGKHPTCQSIADARTLGRYLSRIHDKGVYHADLHPGNIILQPGCRPCLIDAQEVFVLPHMPRWTRTHNLGALFHHLMALGATGDWLHALLVAYNEGVSVSVENSAVFEHCDYHRERRYASRTKRACKNSSDFAIVSKGAVRGYKRKNFSWGPQEVQEALKKGQWLKEDRVLQYRGICIKVHTNRFFHKDRSLKAWKMSRALDVRGITVPKALAYFRMSGKSCFLSQLLVDGIRLNDYLSSMDNESQKRQAIRAFAEWMGKVHRHKMWQRDFKSTNVLVQKENYFMLDQESVIPLRRLPSNRQRIINLAQLNASVSNAVSLKDRLRFFHHYAKDLPSPRHIRRKIYREIWAITETKQTGFFGLDIEKLGVSRKDSSS